MNQFQRQMHQMGKSLDEMERRLDQLIKAGPPDEARDTSGKWTGGGGGAEPGSRENIPKAGRRVNRGKEKLRESFRRATDTARRGRELAASPDRFARDMRSRTEMPKEK